MQLQMNMISQEQIKRSWAFAVDKNKSKRKTLRSMNACVITAVSKEAKNFGISAGMAYGEAKSLLPDLKVFVCNWR